MFLVWIAVGMAIGATFAEGIRAVWRKWTKGRAFGPVPGSDQDPKPPAAS